MTARNFADLFASAKAIHWKTRLSNANLIIGILSRPNESVHGRAGSEVVTIQTNPGKECISKRWVPAHLFVAVPTILRPFEAVETGSEMGSVCKS